MVAPLLDIPVKKIRIIKPRIEAPERTTALWIGGLWAVSVFVANYLRQLDPERQAPIFMVSGIRDPQYQKQAARLGIDRFFVKPLDLDAFVANAGPNQVWFNDGAAVFSAAQELGNESSHAVAQPRPRCCSRPEQLAWPVR